jgi:hypothetical protein
MARPRCQAEKAEARPTAFTRADLCRPCLRGLILEPHLARRSRCGGGTPGATATCAGMRYGVRRPNPGLSTGGSITPAATSTWSDCQTFPGPVDRSLPSSGCVISARPAESSLASRARKVAMGRPERRMAATRSRASAETWIGCSSPLTLGLNLLPPGRCHCVYGVRREPGALSRAGTRARCRAKPNTCNGRTRTCGSWVHHRHHGSDPR